MISISSPAMTISDFLCAFAGRSGFQTRHYSRISSPPATRSMSRESCVFA
jgi:hypothetical protein